MTTADTFRKKVQVFCRKWGYSQSEFGRRALGDPGFVTRLIKKGGAMKLSTMDRVEAWMALGPAVHGKLGERAAAGKAKRTPVRSGSRMRPQIIWTPELDATILRMRLSEHQPWRAIATALGTSMQTVMRRFEKISSIEPKRRYRRTRAEMMQDTS